MDINLDNIAVEIYGKLQTRFPEVKMGDEVGEVLSKEEDIPNARFFEFAYKEDGEVLGTITIKLDEKRGLVVQIGGELVDSDVPGIFKFVRSLSRFASKRLLNFKIVNLEKSNLDKRDYEFQAKKKEETIMPPATPVMESKFYGTSKISYQDLGEARLVIKHNQPVNTEIAAGRTMHIESIYVENNDGERFKYPFKHLNGARALAEHLKHGGNPYDPIGKHITSMSEELAQLRKFKGYVGRNEALAEAMGDIQSRVLERIEQIKEQVQKLQRKSYYETFAESFEEREAQEIPEAVMDDWIDRLTVRTFNEDLKTAFPYIFKLVDESEIPVKELSPEDILAELSKDTLKSYAQKGAYDAAGHMHKAGLDAGVQIGKNDEVDYNHPSQQKAQKRLKNVHKAIYKMSKPEQVAEKAPQGWGGTVKAMKKHKEIDNPYALANYMKNKGMKSHKKTEESYIEEFLNSLVEDQEDQLGHNSLISPNKSVQQAAIEKLNQIMSAELKGGPGGINAIESLKGIIDDPEFLGILKNVDPDLDVRSLVQQYVLQNAPEAAVQLQFGDSEVGGEEPVTPPAELAAPPAPAPAAPEATAAPEAGAVPPGPEAAAVEPPPQGAVPPVAEGMDSNSKLRAKFIKARECGADLSTKMDFGNREMTLQDAIKECGLTPMECGFDQEEEPMNNESGVEQILKSIAGFWNKEERNFTIGGTRVKTKVVKSFKDGEFPNATPEDVKMVLHKIEQMDPSSHEQGQIMKLAGMPQEVEIAVVDHRPGEMSSKISKMSPMESVTFSNEDSLARIIQLTR